MTVQSFSIELGALTEVPVYESHKRGRNWLAVISKDPTAPSGVGRQFCEKAHGEYYYIVRLLKKHDPIEFGGDYISSGGNRRSHRWYGVVLSITDTELRAEQYNTATQAINAAKEYRKPKVAEPVENRRQFNFPEQERKEQQQ